MSNPSPRPFRGSRHATIAAALLGLVTTTLALGFGAAPADANPGGTGLVISEVYGGGGNTGAQYTNDFIELYNPTAAPIIVDGWSVQGRSATNNAAATAGANITPLTGSVPAGGYYLVQEAAGTTVTDKPLPTPDATGTMGMAGGGWQVWLASTTVGQDPADGNVLAGTPNPNIIDLVGAATNSLSFETAVANEAPSNTLATTRNGSNADTDNNADDFSTAAPAPRNSAPLVLDATNPGNKTGTVGQAISGFTMAATNGTEPYLWSDPGNTLPPGISLATNGNVSGTPTAANTYNVTLTVTDSASPTAATDTVSFDFTVNAAPVGVTPIKDIQGTGNTSTMVGQVVATEGVVTASYPTGGLNGFYIQTSDPDTANASDAIFVYGGSGGFASYPAIGDSVDVTGTVAENFGLTELTNASVSTHAPAFAAIAPKTQIPGTDCPLPGDTCLDAAALDTAREAAEGEAFQPTAPWTLTDVYDGGPYYSVGTNSSSMFGEMGAAADSSKPLIAPTELYDNLSANVANRKAYNDAHRIIIDDGSSLNYTTAANTSKPFPWMTASYVPRVGAAVTFPAPAILISDFNQWRLLPSSQVVGAPNAATQPQFQQTRAANATPEDVGGDIKLATFNVLNFFPTTGNEYEGLNANNHCTYFTDRAANQITTQACGNPATSSGNGPRGAANAVNVTRQRDKIVAAINTANADIVSLEELENSAKFGKDRDFAITELVNALNVGNPGKWSFAPSPTGGDLPALADEDVIRTGFIFQPARVSLVGASKILVGSPAFGNAREPLAQAFKKVGSDDADAFAVIVNHFKSKGSGVDDGTGQGDANPDRVAQANALVTFANQFKTDRGITRVFLAGDFNAYSNEDPIQVLNTAGYTNLESTFDHEEESYNFDGQIGSLDHVLANAPALADVNAVDVWQINSYESVYYEYSRFNYNVTDLYAANPFRSSDHNPEIVGINTEPEAGETTVAATGGTVTYGTDWAAHVTVTPATATGTVEVRDGGTLLGTAALSGGAADVSIVGNALQPGPHTLTVNYLGDTTHASSTATFSVTVNKAASTTAATANPSTVTVGVDQSTITVVVGSGGGQPTGTVEARVGGTLVDSGPLASGMATLTVGPFDTVGTTTVQVRYLGDAHIAASQDDATVVVEAADLVQPLMGVRHTPSKVRALTTRPRLIVGVAAGDKPATGWVELRIPGTVRGLVTKVVRLERGRADVRLPAFQARGVKRIRVTYRGNATTASHVAFHSIRVLPRQG